MSALFIISARVWITFILKWRLFNMNIRLENIFILLLCFKLQDNLFWCVFRIQYFKIHTLFLCVYQFEWVKIVMLYKTFFCQKSCIFLITERNHHFWVFKTKKILINVFLENNSSHIKSNIKTHIKYIIFSIIRILYNWTTLHPVKSKPDLATLRG